MTDSLIPAEPIAAKDGSRRARVIALCFGLVLLTAMIISMAQPRPENASEPATPDTSRAPAE